jgi:hypothetical protein
LHVIGSRQARAPPRQICTTGALLSLRTYNSIVPLADGMLDSHEPHLVTQTSNASGHFVPTQLNIDNKPQDGSNPPSPERRGTTFPANVRT